VPVTAALGWSSWKFPGTAVIEASENTPQTAG